MPCQGVDSWKYRFQGSVSLTKWSYSMSRTVSWIVFSSAALLFMPIMVILLFVITILRDHSHRHHHHGHCCVVKVNLSIRNLRNNVGDIMIHNINYGHILRVFSQKPPLPQGGQFLTKIVRDPHFWSFLLEVRNNMVLKDCHADSFRAKAVSLLPSKFILKSLRIWSPDLFL